MAADSVDELISSLRLTEEETIVGEVPFVDEENSLQRLKISLCLIGMVLTGKNFNAPALRLTMLRSWRLRKGFGFRQLSDNLFVFQFFLEDDKKHVLEGGPWCFDDQLVVLREMVESDTANSITFGECSFWVRAYGVPFSCFSKSTAKLIANMIGRFISFDEDDVIGWSNALRFKVAIPIDKPLRRGVLLKLMVGTVRWIQLRYERLPHFCFSCGYMGHVQHECNSFNGEEVLQYGEWLRAMPRKIFQLRNHAEKEKETRLAIELFERTGNGFNGEMGEKARDRVDAGQENNRTSSCKTPLVQLLNELNVGSEHADGTTNGMGRDIGCAVVTTDGSNEKSMFCEDACGLEVVEGSVVSTVHAKKKGTWRRRTREKGQSSDGVNLQNVRKRANDEMSDMVLENLHSGKRTSLVVMPFTISEATSGDIQGHLGT
ncbi:hypothetical protein P3X46_002763 [Hevea brasiliensis]|uniref:CCHC-type domain-containing protein n=1 Tax=Hevea brasiliensis TaxID=3981 RepID=A0ABQ9N5T4_HEVBR|nr:hypothetical protein P3X46_002763 [Hevea brasiliensis]